MLECEDSGITNKSTGKNTVHDFCKKTQKSRPALFQLLGR